jgi:hypothetical protein
VIAAEAAIRAWINGRPDLIGNPDQVNGGGPISRGAYLRLQRSPADGAYVVISRALPGGSEAPVGEPAEELGTARIIGQVYAGSQEMAENAATAYANAVAGCTGRPQRCGQTSTWILSHDNLAGPAYIAAGPTSGEQFCYQVVAEFLLADYGS